MGALKDETAIENLWEKSQLLCQVATHNSELTTLTSIVKDLKEIVEKLSPTNNGRKSNRNIDKHSKD